MDKFRVSFGYNISMLTKRQKQVYEYISRYSKKYRISPTLEEIGKKFHLSSVATVHEHLEQLEKKGYIRKVPGHSRTIEIRDSAEDLAQISLLGTIAAGRPIEAIESKETIAVPQNKLSRGGKFYALRVIGNSMVDENINDGDVVLVKHQETAENGQKIVALIDNYGATLKKFYKEKNQIRLQPANKNIEPIIIRNGKDLAIQGIVIDVIKSAGNFARQNIKFEKENKSAVLSEKNLEKHLNNVFLGDIVDLLKDLPDNSVDMVFGDPDYNVGIKYGDKTYTKNFDEYVNWYIQLTKESLRVLKKDGNLFMMNYPRQNAHLRVKYLDENYPNISEYVWIYNTNVGHTPRRFTTAHRSILHVRKSKNNKFYKNQVALPYKNPTDRRILQNLANGSKGRMPYSWFYYDLVKNVSKEKTFHACQIPQKLTESLIISCTKPKDIVLVLFGGSGSELVLCKSLGRQYVSAEIDEKYHKLISDRLESGIIKEEHKLRLRESKNVIRVPSLSLI